MSRTQAPFVTPAELVDELKRLPRKRQAYERSLERIRFDIDRVRRYCEFSPDFYTRNLIARTEDFEILTLCWEPGQISPIHDHTGSDGRVVGMDGEVEEVWYECRPRPNGSADSVRGRVARVGPGALTYIHDEIAWHTVGNPGTVRAVTIHLYSPPIDHCQYFEPESGKIRTRSMSYFSIDGVLV